MKLKTPIEKLFSLLICDREPTETEKGILLACLNDEKEIVNLALNYVNWDEDHFTIECFYELVFNQGLNVCPKCRQGVLRRKDAAVICQICEYALNNKQQ